jgi:uncharacterized membrane protein YdjX (TVP38/TMEM64 family)
MTEAAIVAGSVAVIAAVAGFLVGLMLARRTLRAADRSLADGKPYPELRKFIAEHGAEIEKRIEARRRAGGPPRR